MRQMVSVTEILQNVTGSDDFRDFDGSPDSWFLMMVDKLLGQPSVAMLVRTDITPENFDTVQIIINDDGSWRIGDGHHRLVTAILRGDDSVPVTHEYGDPASTAHESSMPETYIEDDFINTRWLAQQIGQTQQNLLEMEYQG